MPKLSTATTSCPQRLQSTPVKALQHSMSASALDQSRLPLRRKACLVGDDARPERGSSGAMMFPYHNLH